MAHRCDDTVDADESERCPQTESRQEQGPGAGAHRPRTAWAPFGWLPVRRHRPEGRCAPDDVRLGRPHVNLIGHTLDEVPETATRPALRDAVPPRHPHPGPDAAQRAGGHRGGARPGSSSPTAGGRRLDPCLPAASRWSPWCCTGARGTGARSPSGAARCALFNVQGLRYAEDNRRVDLAGQGHVGRGGPDVSGATGKGARRGA